MPNWTLTRTVDATTEPLTLAEAKEHLRVTHSQEDDYITTVIAVARQWVESYLLRALITQTWQLTLDDFPSHDRWETRDRKRFYPEFTDTPIRLFRPPVQSVSSIAYLDSSGTSQTWASSLYDTALDRVLPVVVPIEGQTYPDTQAGTPNAVTVTYVAGYGDAASDVPSLIVHGVKMVLGQLYCNRELDGFEPGIQFGLGNVLGPYRVQVSGKEYEEA